MDIVDRINHTVGEDSYNRTLYDLLLEARDEILRLRPSFRELTNRIREPEERELVRLRGRAKELGIK